VRAHVRLRCTSVGLDWTGLRPPWHGVALTEQPRQSRTLSEFCPYCAVQAGFHAGHSGLGLAWLCLEEPRLARVLGQRRPQLRLAARIVQRTRYLPPRRECSEYSRRATPVRRHTRPCPAGTSHGGSGSVRAAVGAGDNAAELDGRRASSARSASFSAASRSNATLRSCSCAAEANGEPIGRSRNKAATTAARACSALVWFASRLRLQWQSVQCG
jgi:hypothetical protein